MKFCTIIKMNLKIFVIFEFVTQHKTVKFKLNDTYMKSSV
jgi:hypothetical protein